MAFERIVELILFFSTERRLDGVFLSQPKERPVRIYLIYLFFNPRELCAIVPHPCASHSPLSASSPLTFFNFLYFYFFYFFIFIFLDFFWICSDTAPTKATTIINHLLRPLVSPRAGCARCASAACAGSCSPGKPVRLYETRRSARAGVRQWQCQAGCRKHGVHECSWRVRHVNARSDCAFAQQPAGLDRPIDFQLESHGDEVV